MHIIVLGTSLFLNDLIMPGSKLLDKIQAECHKLGMSKGIEKAYEDAFKKHRIVLTIPARRIEEVRDKLWKEGKWMPVGSSKIDVKTKGIEIKGIEEKYKKFLELAIAINANYIVTEAGSLLSKSDELKRKFKIEVVRLEDWLKEVIP